MTLVRVINKRYLLQPTKYRGRLKQRFEADLQPRNVQEQQEQLDAEYDDRKPWLSETEFIVKYSIVCLVIISSFLSKRSRTMKSSKHRKEDAHRLRLRINLCVFFFTLVGTEGGGSRNEFQRAIFGIGRGTVEIYRSRVATAICSLRDEYVFWPDEEERNEIANRIMRDYGIPNTVGIADGTLHSDENHKLMMLQTNMVEVPIFFEHHDH